MSHSPVHSMPATATAQGGSNVRALVIITILFFMWGMLTSLNDVLIPHLKSVYTLTYVQAMLVQFCFFGAYFVVSLPAGGLVRRIGYQRGAVAGLVIASTGCALFYPAASSGYGLFLLALFVLASGITILQVAANPFVTLIGDPRTASSRLNLTQAFNSLGTTVGPLFGGLLILGGVALVSEAELAAMTEVERAAHRAAEVATVQTPYLMLAGALLLLAVVFAFARLPRVEHAAAASGPDSGPSLLSRRNLVLGAVAIFLYVGAEVSIGSFLVSFLSEPDVAGLDHATAANYVAYYWGLAMVGRFLGFAVMRKVSPGLVLGISAGGAILLILFTLLGSGRAVMWAILAVGLFNSIMFPTIFSIALHGLGARTGQGSGVLCMAIVGGAVVPFAQGYLADNVGLQPSFVVPMLCYGFILYFGLRYARVFLGDPARP
ncbi:sugar MFS transporter [Arenimonas sp. MALMAid1274]|uniref:sugar MFS transporter n=1 Tax=Arenimonas sp. MALMAid1274 TaxID=3411630 RepID=UPI003B9E5309